MIYLIGIYFFVFSAVNFADISSTSTSPRFSLSVIFLIGLVLSNPVKISFSNSVLISEIVLVLTAKFSNALCYPISREAKIFLSPLKRGIIPLHSKIFRQEFSRMNFLPQKRGAKLVTVTNQPVSIPPSTSYAYSQTERFFSSTIWNYRRLPT